MPPEVSVVMSVYNGEKYLAEAIESILNQRFTDFEFIIIDDGSFDSSPSLLARYGQRDPRILIHRFDRNRGLSTALNFGIHHARGEYIARMDGDDISLPNRLQEQVVFMDAHPKIDICGTWVELIGDFQGQVWKYPTQHEAIYARMLFANTLVHPSVIMRVVSIKRHALLYDENIRYAQDYELWSRAVTSVKLANLDQILLKHRIHAQGTGAKHREGQYKKHEMIYRRLLSPFELEYIDENLSLHQQIGTYKYGEDIEFLRRARHWLEGLSRANHNTQVIPSNIFDAELSARWTQSCQFSLASPFALGFEILASPLPFRNATHLVKLRRALSFVFQKFFKKKQV